MDTSSLALLGLVYCHCGARMVGSKDSDNETGYRCGGAPQTASGRHRHPRRYIRHARVERELLDWLEHLAHDPRRGEQARTLTRRCCEQQWQHARHLARVLSVVTDTGDTADLEARPGALAEAEAQSLWCDPVQRAADLLTDWPLLNPAMRHLRTRQLVDRLVIAGGTQPRRVLVKPMWTPAQT